MIKKFIYKIIFKRRAKRIIRDFIHTINTEKRQQLYREFTDNQELCKKVLGFRPFNSSDRVPLGLRYYDMYLDATRSLDNDKWVKSQREIDRWLDRVKSEVFK